MFCNTSNQEMLNIILLSKGNCNLGWLSWDILGMCLHIDTSTNCPPLINNRFLFCEKHYICIKLKKVCSIELRCKSNKGSTSGGTLIFSYIRRLGSFFGFKYLNFNIF